MITDPRQLEAAREAFEGQNKKLFHWKRGGSAFAEDVPEGDYVDPSTQTRWLEWQRAWVASSQYRPEVNYEVLPQDQVMYPRDIFHALLRQGSPYAFYLMQWTPYQTSAKKWRLKLLHDVRTFDGREAYSVYPNGDHLGPFLDNEVEYIRISKSQLGYEFVDPRKDYSVPPPQTTNRNPYAGKGQLEEAWLKGFTGGKCKAAPSSSYGRAFRAGQEARAALDQEPAFDPLVIRYQKVLDVLEKIAHARIRDGSLADGLKTLALQALSVNRAEGLETEIVTRLTTLGQYAEKLRGLTGAETEEEGWAVQLIQGLKKLKEFLVK